VATAGFVPKLWALVAFGERGNAAIFVDIGLLTDMGQLLQVDISHILSRTIQVQTNFRQQEP
jgi:hypothetical protein